VDVEDFKKRKGIIWSKMKTNKFDLGWIPPSPENLPSQLTGRIDELRSTLQSRDPNLIAAQSSISYLTSGQDRGEFHIPFLGSEFTVTWPNLTGYSETHAELPPIFQVLLLYYLATADGTALIGNWVSFADLPNGRIYNAAFQGYSGDEIVKTFGVNLPAFKSACLKVGGVPLEVGSASFVIQALPALPMLVTYWLGDEDFPSSCKILFDSSATHYMPIDGCAITGSMLAKKLRKANNTVLISGNVEIQSKGKS
jgi:hypothetical protein